MYSSRVTVDLALLLSELDVLDRENALICGVSKEAIRHWRRGSRRSERTEPALRARSSSCPRCHGRELDSSAYAYLLGLYLGDGRITLGRRGVYVLSIYCGDDWPGLANAAEHAMACVMPTSGVFRVAKIDCHAIKSSSKHWPCLFPQHGPGRKHERKIELKSWQQAIVTEHPGHFARGLPDGLHPVRRIVTGYDRS